MKFVLLASLFLACVTASAQARLGESMPQLVERYGDPLPKDKDKNSPDNMATFQRNGFQIDVTLLDGISAVESFKKLNGDPFTVEEVQTLLADNSGGRAWQAPQAVHDEKQWMRDDGSMATLTHQRILKLTSVDMLRAETTNKQLQAAPSLDGF